MKYSAALLLTLPIATFCNGPFDKTVQEETKKFVNRIKQGAEEHVADCGSNGAYQIYSWLDTQLTTHGFEVLEPQFNNGQALAQLTFDDSEYTAKIEAFSKKVEELAASYGELFKTFHRLNREQLKKRGHLKVSEPAKKNQMKVLRRLEPALREKKRNISLR